MKKNIFRSALIGIFIIWLFQSCSEDFLNTAQSGATLQEDFYKTNEDALQALMAIYNHMQGDNAMSYMEFNVLLSDECYAGGGGRGDNYFLEEINEFTFGSSNTTLSGQYDNYYRGIYLCNKVIDNVDDATEIRKTIIAEAKVWRAFYYFQLITYWGRVPLVLHELSLNEYAQPRVDDIAKNWSQVEKDLTEAIAVLPVRSEQGSNVFRFSKGYAQALYGEVLLFQEKYDAAAVPLEDVITSGEYGLYLGDKYADIFKKEQEFGIESLFEISHYSDVSNPQESFFYPAMTGPRVGTFWPGSSGLEFMGFGACAPRISVYDAFVAENDTFRRQGTIWNEADLGAYGATLRLDGGKLQYAGEGVVKVKYGNWTSETTEPEAVIHYGTNLRIMRYSEVLLMAAEAFNRSSSPNDGKAQGYLNEVRDRAHLPGVSSTGDALFEDIKTERRLELCFEGVRYRDLLRWGDAETVLADQGHYIPMGNGTNFENTEYGFKEKHKLLPFPETEVLVNKYIAADQNPGW